MPEQQQGLPSGMACEIHLQMVAELLRTVELYSSTKRVEPSSYHRAQAVHCLLDVTGRLDLDQALNGLYNFVPALLEMSQIAVCVVGGGIPWRFFRNGFFIHFLTA
jgi:hypothetical protein